MGAAWKDEALCGRFPDLPWIAEPQDCSRASRAAMRVVCSACPVQAECEAYVDRMGILGGFWAGQDRTPAAEASQSGGAA